MRKKIFLSFSLFFVGVFLVFLIFKINKYHQEMHITYSSSHTPMINVKIDKKLYRLIMDFGSVCQISLNKNILDIITKESLDKKFLWKDGLGNVYESKTFLISKIYLGDIKLFNVIANEENQAYLNNTTLWEEETDDLSNECGVIGRPILERYNVLCDFKNNRIYISNNWYKLKKSGFDLTS